MNMTNSNTKTDSQPKTSRCSFVETCYMAEDLKCFGYKIDCPLYRESNGQSCSKEDFDRAMDTLIDSTLTKYRA